MFNALPLYAFFEGNEPRLGDLSPAFGEFYVERDFRFLRLGERRLGGFDLELTQFAFLLLEPVLQAGIVDGHQPTLCAVCLKLTFELT